MRTDLARLRERLEVQRSLLDEYRLKMLIAETPLADGQLRAAAESFLSIDEEVRRAEAALESLHRERQRLAGGLTTAGA